jgi:D-alanine-D-alanine ligase
MSTGKRVAVVFGGRSVEHEISLRSARTVVEALREAGFQPLPVAVTRNGTWLGGSQAESLLAGGESPAGGSSIALLPDPQVRGLAAPAAGGGWDLLPVDAVFPLIHGIGGEDGTLQGLLELADLPYVGSDVSASALGMSKRLQRRLWRAAGLPVLDTVEIHRREWEQDPEGQTQRILERIGAPCFLKPSGSGSSVGVGLAHSADEIPGCVLEAARYDEYVLADTAMDARELECAVLGNREPRSTTLGEIIPQREFYEYRAKYLEDTTRLVIPAEVDRACVEQARRLAMEAFLCLGCSGLARVDFFLDKQTGELVLNEINTLPGFTSISMYPLLWAHEGMQLPELVGQLVELAMERHAEVRRSRRTLA